MQVTPAARKQLADQGELPAHYNTDLQANLQAGANYYAIILYDFNVPESEAAAAYNGGPTAHRHNRLPDESWDYQDSFDAKKDSFDDVIKCIHGGH